MSTNIQIVKNFCEAMGRNQKAEILTFFDQDSVFENVPMNTVKGPEKIWDVLGLMHDTAKHIEYVIHHIAESKDGVVMTERTDIYTLNNQQAEFRVMGLFVIQGEKIRLWRDYFDLQQIMEQLKD